MNITWLSTPCWAVPTPFSPLRLRHVTACLAPDPSLSVQHSSPNPSAPSLRPQPHHCYPASSPRPAVLLPYPFSLPFTLFHNVFMSSPKSHRERERERDLGAGAGKNLGFFSLIPLMSRHYKTWTFTDYTSVSNFFYKHICVLRRVVPGWNLPK